MSLFSTEKYGHLVGVSVLLAFLLPHTNIFFFMVNPILCFILWFVGKVERNTILNYLVCIAIFITLLIGLFSGVETKSVIRAITLILYFALFPFVNRTTIPNTYLVSCILFIILSQIATLFSIPYVSGMLDMIYPIEEASIDTYDYQRANVTMNTLSDFRMGGLYHNSNQCAKYMLFLFVFYLINNRDKYLKDIMPVVILSSISVIITGSRTGLSILLIVLFCYFINIEDLSILTKIIISIFAVLLGIFIFTNGSDTNLRGLKVNEGFDNSLAAKYETLAYYLSTEDSPIRILLGYLDTSLYKAAHNLMDSFDGEFGVIIFSYGFIGLAFLFMFYVEVFRLLNGFKKIYYILMLWMISSTIIGSYRCSFIFLLMLSSIVSETNTNSIND